MDTFRVEFHCHTIVSKDSLTRPERLVEAARQKGLQRVIITDHNSTAGALRAQQIDPELVIVGEEIMTTRGEILAAFVTEEIPPRLTPQETIRRLRDQGAFISVSHPFDVMRKGHWDLPDLLEIAPLVDAIETFNSRCFNRAFNTQAQAFAQQYNLPGTVGSDAHTTFELAISTLHLAPFANGDDLRRVIRNGRPQTRLSLPFIQGTSRFAVIAKKLGFGKYS